MTEQEKANLELYEKAMRGEPEELPSKSGGYVTFSEFTKEVWGGASPSASVEGRLPGPSLVRLHREAAGKGVRASLRNLFAWSCLYVKYTWRLWRRDYRV